MGVHQGSALNLLFVLEFDEEITKNRGDGIRELLYADDLALTAETIYEKKTEVISVVKLT